MKKYDPKQAVELFHLLFLSQLGRKLDKKLYVLKGGCNMRFYFNSIRYSEDIDLDVQIINKETLQKNVNKILNSAPFKTILQAHNLQILQFTTPKQTHLTQRWKVSLKLSGNELPLQTKIEFSRRTFGNDVNFESINPSILYQYSLPPIILNHYFKEGMYEQKILALALRNETQARDVFDIYFLISTDPYLKLCKDSEAYKNISQAITNARSISFADFKGQVLAYLTEDYQVQYDNERMWKDILKQVINSIEESRHEPL